MLGFVACPILTLVVLLLSSAGTRGTERKLVQLGFLAHIAGTCAIVAFHVYVTSGDMLGYAFYGRQLARLIDTDFSFYAPEVAKLALHLEHRLPPIAGYDDPASADYLTGTTTTTMFALAGLVMSVVGTNLFAASLAFSLFAFGGTAFFYKRLRSSLLEHERLPVLRAMMFVPSVIFWSSGIVKEAVLLGFFGLLCGGLCSLFQGRWMSSVLVVIGATGVGVVKPYAIFPLALTVGAWLNARRRRKQGWSTRIAAVVIALLALALLSRFFPEFSVDKLGESVAQQQSAAVFNKDAGSYVEIGAAEERSLLGQIRFVPLALVNALARPFFFEARNASMLMASLETLAAAILLVSLARRHGVRGLYRRIAERPPLVAAAVFTISFGAAVGLATTNLGTLTRYRLPMVPMYAALLLALRARPSKMPAIVSPPQRQAKGRRLRRGIVTGNAVTTLQGEGDDIHPATAAHQRLVRKRYGL